MDILAHTLWTAALAKSYKKTTKQRFRVGWAACFGVAPDLAAFTLLVLWIGIHVITGDVLLVDIPKPSEIEPLVPDTLFIFRLTSLLYSMSHSAVVFGFVFLAASLIRRRMPFELFGWLVHIVIDLFTHTYAVMPTPVLWPLSEWRFNGVSWQLPWMMAVNYSILVVVYASLYRRQILGVFTKFLKSRRPGLIEVENEDGA